MNKYNYVPVSNDTDSISFRKQDGSPFTEQEQTDLIDEINQLMPRMIEYEHDGYYDKVVVLKAKNYILKEGDKIKLKGSSISDSKKEGALQEMINLLIQDLMDTDGQNYISIYEKYVKEAANIKDIPRWSVKKSITKSVLNPERTNEQKVLDALDGYDISEGDKVYLYSAIDGQVQKVIKGEPQFLRDGSPKMVENRILKHIDEFNNDMDFEHYIKRVYKTLEIFKNVLDVQSVTKYHLKSKLKLVENL